MSDVYSRSDTEYSVNVYSLLACWVGRRASGASGRLVLNCASASDVTAADSGGGGAGSAAGAGSVAGFTTAGFVSARNSDTGAPAGRRRRGGYWRGRSGFGED